MIVAEHLKVLGNPAHLVTTCATQNFLLRRSSGRSGPLGNSALNWDPASGNLLSTSVQGQAALTGAVLSSAGAVEVGGWLVCLGK